MIRGVLRRMPLVAVVLAAVVAVSGCGGDDPSVASELRDRLVVVVSAGPVAELATRIGGPDVTVINLTALGESPHELELTPRDRDELEHADLAIVVGGGFQPEVEQAAHRREGPTLDAFEQLKLGDPARAVGPTDDHIWMDPRNMASMASAVGEAFAALEPGDAAGYRTRARELVDEVGALDRGIEYGLSACQRRVFVAQHDGFGWFAARYSMTVLVLDADDDGAADQPVLDAIADGSVSAIFIDPLDPSPLADDLAVEDELERIQLDPFDGLTPGESVEGATYTSILTNDLDALRSNLDCGGE